MFSSKQVKAAPIKTDRIDSGAAAERLAGMLRFRTISHQDKDKSDAGEFLKLHRYLEENFPGVHANLKKEAVAGYSLLYKWQGSDESLKPILLMSHLDVVPVEEGTEGDWEYPPFDGRIADGYVWGRGALDIKVGVGGILEAVETLIGEGFQPRRTVYLAFGHDEEVGGKAGAVEIVKLLKSRGVRLEYVLDEGGAIVEKFFSGFRTPVAFVGTAEKGYVTLELTVESEGGHSSMPPRHTTVGILAKAISKLENHPFPASLKGIERTFRYLGPEMPLPLKAVFANSRLFAPALKIALSMKKETNAAIRTTIAPTMIEGSEKENVLPAKATAAVNFRILQGDSSEDVVARVRKVIGDERVKVKIAGSNLTEPSPVSDDESESFRMLARTIRGVFPEVIVAPSTVLGGTDSRHYVNISDSVYRFIPTRVGPDDVKRVHGANERVSVKNYAEVVAFFMEIMRNS